MTIWNSEYNDWKPLLKGHTMDQTKNISSLATELRKANLETLNSVSYISGSSSHKVKVSNAAFNGEYISQIVYLLQAGLSGYNLCPHATKSCKEICLGTNSGHAAMVKHGEKTNKVQISRLKKTILFKQYPDVFFSRLERELTNLEKRATKKGVKAAFRFNGCSDIPFHAFSRIVEKFPNIMFYDYTKNFFMMKQFLKGNLPSNFHLTFSFAPEKEEQAETILNLGGNVAIAFETKKASDFVGKTYKGCFPVISGDNHDLRFTDPQGGFIIGLTKKGRKKGEFFQSTDILENDQQKVTA